MLNYSVAELRLNRNVYICTPNYDVTKELDGLLVKT